MIMVSLHSNKTLTNTLRKKKERDRKEEEQKEGERRGGTEEGKGKRRLRETGLAVHTWNPSTLETGGFLQVQGQPDLHNEASQYYKVIPYIAYH